MLYFFMAHIYFKKGNLILQSQCSVTAAVLSNKQMKRDISASVESVSVENVQILHIH